jgi:hypothetical protein
MLTARICKRRRALDRSRPFKQNDAQASLHHVARGGAREVFANRAANADTIAGHQ